MKRTILILFINLCVLIGCSIALSYNGPVTHTQMSRKAVEISDLEEYLSNSLGLKENLKFTDADTEQERIASEWIEYGSAAEDSGTVGPLLPIPRVLRHFHNPINNRGLYDPAPTSWNVSLLEWGTTREENIWNWNKARDYYYLALTSRTAEERSNYFAKMFRALGQIMHLIQDSTVPSHVRNDQHAESAIPIPQRISPFEQVYEKWVQYNINPMQLYSAPFDYSAIPNFTVNHFWDQELYTGTEYPNYNYFPANAGIAEYTNYHFLSEDTLFLDPEDDDAALHYFPHPNIENTDFDPVQFPEILYEAEDGITDRIHVINGYGNYPLAGVKYVAKDIWEIGDWGLPDTREAFIRKYCLNVDHDTVFSMYALRLVPKAVSSSVGLLNYFFRKELDVNVEVDPTGWLVFCVSCEGIDVNDLYENIKIYCEDQDGNRRVLLYEHNWYQKDIISESIRMKIHPYCSTVKFILVYKGPLQEEGEEDVVIGKVINIAVNSFCEREGQRVKDEILSCSRPDEYLSIRNAVYLNFQHSSGEWIEWEREEPFSGFYGVGHITAAGYFPPFGHATQRVYRNYARYNFNYLKNETIDRLILVMYNDFYPIGATKDLLFYIDTSNSWPVNWGGGGILLYRLSHDDRGVDYNGVKIKVVEVNPEIIGPSGVITLESCLEDDEDNYIPLAPPGLYDEGASARIIEIIFYSENEDSD